MALITKSRNQVLSQGLGIPTSLKDQDSGKRWAMASKQVTDITIFRLALTGKLRAGEIG
jgi:hypothetical protein